MAGADNGGAPTPDEAFARLKGFADMFLQGGARLPGDPTATSARSAPARSATIIVDEDGRVLGLDAEGERLLGRRSSDVLGVPLRTFLPRLPLDPDPIASIVNRPDGRDVTVWVTRTGVPVDGRHVGVITLNEHDVMSGRRTELRYRHLVEQIPAVVFTAALDGGLYDIYVSPQIEDLLGYSQEEWLADPVLWYERLHEDDRRKLDEEFARGCLTGGPFRADCRFLTREGKVVWVHGEARLIKDERGFPILLQGVAFDITETKRAEEIVRASLLEKETLLKEIHHRVKNNLQVTSSLLKLQAEQVTDESAKTALRAGQGRIRSMALVHELLYRSKDFSQVDLGEYIRDLSRQLLRTHTTESSRVRLETTLAPVPLPIDLAVPCVLVLNELISNALKHGFPGGRTGTIWIELRPYDGYDELVVRDDGVGLPADVDFRSGSTLGLRLIRTLADQIEAELEVHSSGGTEVSMRIPRRHGGRT